MCLLCGFLAETHARLVLDFANPSGGIELFTITQADLNFYCAQSGTLLNNGGLTLEVWFGGVMEASNTFTNNQDFLTTPLSFDLDSIGFSTWTQVNSVQARILVDLGVATTLVTCSADAVELVIAANRVIVP